MSNRRIHVALAVRDLPASIQDYTARLGVEPCCIVEDTYALWRTDHLNLSISVKPDAVGTRTGARSLAGLKYLVENGKAYAGPPRRLRPAPSIC